MSFNELTDQLSSGTTRRAIVKTGAKLAYAAPLVAATMKLSSRGAFAAVSGRGASDCLGTRWDETESGWTGVWTRIGTGNQFATVWTKDGNTVTDTITITVDCASGAVSINRPPASDGNACTYTGTMSGHAVSGTYSCTFGTEDGPHAWSATVS